MTSLALLCALSLPLPLQEPAPSTTPVPERGLIRHEPEACTGYTLFAPLRSRTTFLIDMEGNEVHRWESEHPPLSVYLEKDGTLLRGSRIDENPIFFGGGLGGRIQELMPDGRVSWNYVLSDAKQCLHHDFEPLPNGNVLAIAWEALSKDEAVALGRDPAQSDGGLWPDWVLEIRPTRPEGGQILWEWHAKDHLIQDFDASKPNHGSIPDHPGRIDINADHRAEPPLSDEARREQEQREEDMRALGYAGGDDKQDDDAAVAPGGPPRPPRRSGDWLHTNSIDYQAATDLILLSVPELSEIWIIDHSTTTAEARGSSGGRWKKGGDLLYRWGNPRAYGTGTSDDQQLFYQHQPEWVPTGLPGAGNVTIFNNGSKRPRQEYSSIEELVLPFDPARGFLREPGTAFGPARPLWSYSDPENFFSFFISGCQRLENGNTLICSGKQGRFFEVTHEGRIVWEYRNPFGGEIDMGMGKASPQQGNGPVEATSCFRATRLAPDHPGVQLLLAR